MLDRFRARSDGVHAFGHNSAEGEPIWMKSGAPWVHCLELALADFGWPAHSVVRTSNLPKFSATADAG